MFSQPVKHQEVGAFVPTLSGSEIFSIAVPAGSGYTDGHTDINAVIAVLQDGATVALVVDFNGRGTFDATDPTAYAQRDFVHYDDPTGDASGGYVYINATPSLGSANAPTDSAFWQLVAEDGTRILTGAAAPTTATGGNNDAYINSDGIWLRSGNTWVQLVDFTALGGGGGASAEDIAAAIAAHLAVADPHNIVRTADGTTAGQTIVDIVPDFVDQLIVFFDTTPRGLYVATGTTAGAIEAVGSTSTGTGGIAGEILFGAGAPAAATGSEGDYYIDTTTGDFYKKASGGWSLETNLQGPAGAQGIQGTAGANGTDGTDGVDGTAATVVISGIDTLPAGSAPTVTEQVGSTPQARDYRIAVAQPAAVEFGNAADFFAAPVDKQLYFAEDIPSLGVFIQSANAGNGAFIYG